MRTQPDRLEATFRDRAQARILLESGTEAEWIARVLEGLGHEVIVAGPNYAIRLLDQPAPQFDRGNMVATAIPDNSESEWLEQVRWCRRRGSNPHDP